MKKIPKNFNYNKYDYKLISERDRYAIYELSILGVTYGYQLCQIRLKEPLKEILVYKKEKGENVWLFKELIDAEILLQETIATEQKYRKLGYS